MAANNTKPFNPKLATREELESAYYALAYEYKEALEMLDSIIHLEEGDAELIQHANFEVH